MVNTFLPYSNYKKIAQVLDTKRLGKQRVEAKQVLNAIQKNTGWRNHPCAKMWKPYINSLKQYYNIMIDEWVKRGYVNNMKKAQIRAKKITKPWFVNNRTVNLSHQAMLVTKLPQHYKQYFKRIPKDYFKYSYVWPSNLTDEQIKQLKKNPTRAKKISLFAKKRVVKK